MTEQELIDYALKCIRGEEPVFELAHKIAGKGSADGGSDVPPGYDARRGSQAAFKRG